MICIYQTINTFDKQKSRKQNPRKQSPNRIGFKLIQSICSNRIKINQMDQSWRHPRPNQGNICPTCSISHFPFCPPHPYPSRPNFEPNRGPINMGRPDFVNNQDPFRDPGYRIRNPNLPPQLGYNNVSDDRSSKRLRVDEGSVVNDYGGVNTGFGFDGGLRRYPHESLGFDRNVDSREVGGLRMGDKVGMGLGHGVHYPHESSGFDRNVDSLRMVNIGEMGVGHGVHYPHERSGFERNVDSSRVVNQGEMGVGHGVHYPHERSGFDRNVDSSRVVNQGEMGNLVGVGHGVHYQKDDYGYRSGYDSGYNVDHGRLGNEYHGRNYELGVAHPPSHGSFSHGGFGVDNESQSFGYRPPNYGNNFEHVQSNGNALHFDKRSNMAAPNEYPSTRPPFQPGQMGYGYHSPHHFGGVRQPVDPRPPPVEGYQSVGNQNVPTRPPFEPPHMSKPSEYGNSFPEYVSHVQPPQRYEFQPPLPSSPPPPLPKEPPIQWSAEHNHSSSPKKEFPPHMRSSAAVHYPHPPTADSHVRVNPPLGNIKIDHASRGSFQGESQGITPTFGQYSRSSQALPSKNNLPDKPRALDAAHIFKRPHRTSRPDHFVIILRGLPGSGKSYFAKMLRDLELEHGGSAPRVHSMDDYFMTEVEKTEENEGSKPLARGKKPVTKTVIEYCYEPEMEEAYRSSMLKAFKKTLEEGVYTFVIVDDRNLRVADFAQFWATAKRSGYEAYVLEAPYKDPAGCAARNVHGFSQNDVEKMAAQWEESPSLYLQLDVKSLFHGDDLKESSIKEVDMDTEDGDFDTSLSNWDEKQAETTSLAENISLDVSPNDERNLDSEIGNQTEEVKDLGRSKWSNNLDDEGDERSELLKGRANVLSGLLGTYGKEGKSVHWGDQGGHSGFSIGKKAKMASLVIGPGAGYNLKSNPLCEEDTLSGKTEETKKHNVFKQRLQAERESFRAVFDRRRHCIGGVFAEEE